MLAPGAFDASVRPAGAADVSALGAVQVRSWRRSYADLLPASLLAGLSADQLATGWRAAVNSPPSARHAVLVACSGAMVVGLAALAPSTDQDAAPTDAELVALEVDPAHQRAGHGSRLLAAVADIARNAGFTTLRTWLPARDDVRRAFLESAGFRPDGARRQLRTTIGADPRTDGDARTGRTDGTGAAPQVAEVSEVRLVAALPS